jgi:hypothetical protein
MEKGLRVRHRKFRRMLRSITPKRATSLDPAPTIGPPAAAGIAAAGSHPGRPVRRYTPAARRSGRRSGRGGPAGTAERQAPSGQASPCLGSCPPGRGRLGRGPAKRTDRAGGGPDGADRTSGTAPGLFVISSLCQMARSGKTTSRRRSVTVRTMANIATPSRLASAWRYASPRRVPGLAPGRVALLPVLVARPRVRPIGGPRERI